MRDGKPIENYYPGERRDDIIDLLKIFVPLGGILLVGSMLCYGWYQDITKQAQEPRPAVEKPAERQDTIQPELSPLPKQQELRFDSKNAPKGTKRVTFQGTGIPSQRTNA